ncbi:glycoside hydrolase family 73 protein [Companilactobacillus sp. DQM5]|uniref:glycoside hydrolase family 73 protein n=1 Tax=Companilactobacillus sp. DQM5 TaxID=3463359 RepID=UPI0040589D40
MSKKKRRRNKKNSYITILLFVCLIVVLITTVFLAMSQYKIIQNNKPSKTEIVEQKRNEFIDKISPYAITLKKQYGILPSITISQAIVESNWGKSVLARDYNNFFGVKGTDPTNTKVLYTKEFVNGKWIEIHGRFRVYSDYKDSMKDHAVLLANGTSWNPRQYHDVLAAQDYVDATFALQTDGYATDPTYTKKLLKIIKQYNLDRFDN